MRSNNKEQYTLLSEIEELKEELNQSQKQFATQKEQMDDLLSSIDEVIFVANAYNFDVVYMNAACFNVYGYTAEEMMADRNIFIKSIHPDDKEYFYECYMKLFHAGRSDHEFRVCHKDGSIKVLQAKTVLKKGDGTTPDVIRGITIDITDLRAAEQKLKDQLEHIQLQNKKLLEISWIQSHKVRGPVANMLGLAKIFNYQEVSDPLNIEVITAFRTSAEDLDNIITEINCKASAANLYA